MKFKSQVLTQASGSIGGITYSHNRGGMYQRARSIPTNPNSTAQQLVRNAMASLVAAWTGILTAPERLAWETYAVNTPVSDTLGDPLTLTGQQMYIRCNTPRVAFGATRIDPGPTVFGNESLAPITIAVVGPSATIAVTFDDTETWPQLDDCHMIVQASRGQSASVNYFGGPFRFADIFDGVTAIPITSPQNATSPFVYATGQKLFVRARISMADGRLSSPQIVNAIAS